jgi:hypothetical protein
VAGIRNSYLSREAYRLRATGSTAEQILLRLRAYNETRCDPPLPDEEVIEIARAPSGIAVGELARFEGFVGFAAANAPEPQDLRAPPRAAQCYPLEALGSIVGPAARRIHQVIQAPEAICGQSLLAAASLAAQAHADVEMDGQRYPLSLFALSIGESGERQSRIDRLALKVHHEHERAALELHRHEMLTYEIARAAHEAARRLARRGKHDAASIRKALEALGAAPTAPPTPLFLAPAAQLESLAKLYAGGQASIGLFHDDGGEIIGARGATQLRHKSAAALCRLWDTGEVSRAKGGAGAKYFGRRLAMHLMVHPDLAQRVLADEALLRQGFLARTLLVWPASPVGERSYVEGDLTVDPALVRYHERIRMLLARTPPLTSPGELAPRTLSLEPSARHAWIAAHDVIEASQVDGGPFASIRPWASKAPAQILRIAGVLRLIEDPEAELIGADTIDLASTLVQHHLEEAARLFWRTRVPVEVRNAEALRDWCHRQGIRQLHSGEALQFGPHSLRTAAIFDAAIAVLERKGWATRIEGGCVIDGKKRRRAWNIATPRPELPLLLPPATWNGLTRASP